MIKDEGRKFGLFRGYYGMTNVDVAQAVNIHPNRVTKAYYEGSFGATAVSDRKLIAAYTDMRTKVLRDKVAADVSAAIGDGEIQVILPTDDKIVVLVDGEVLGWYNPDTGKIGKI